MFIGFPLTLNRDRSRITLSRLRSVEGDYPEENVVNSLRAKQLVIIPASEL